MRNRETKLDFQTISNTRNHCQAQPQKKKFQALFSEYETIFVKLNEVFFSKFRRAFLFSSKDKMKNEIITLKSSQNSTKKLLKSENLIG